MRNRGLVITLVVLAALVLVGPLIGGGMMGAGLGPGMMRGFGQSGVPANGWMWGAGMGLGSLSMLAFWAAIIIGGILVYRSMSGSGHSAPDSPEEILKRRFASGQITREQYDDMRHALEH